LDGRRTGPRLGPDAMAKSRILTKVGNGTPTRHPTVGQSLYWQTTSQAGRNIMFCGEKLRRRWVR